MLFCVGAASCFRNGNASTECRAAAAPAASAKETPLPPCPPIPGCGDGPELSEEQAVAFAEAFVRAAGYADTPASCFVPESVTATPPDRELAARRDELLPKAYAARRERDLWTVVFRYNADRHPGVSPPQRPGGGRAVIIDDKTGSLRIQHKDVILGGFEPRPDPG